jgi:hypothetical protein
MIEQEGDHPVPPGLIFSVSELIKQYGPVDVVRACEKTLGAALARADIPTELREAITSVSSAMKPNLLEAIDEGWERWPYK